MFLLLFYYLNKKLRVGFDDGLVQWSADIDLVDGDVEGWRYPRCAGANRPAPVEGAQLGVALRTIQL